MERIKYIEPEIEIIEFDTEDVITDSVQDYIQYDEDLTNVVKI